MKEIINNYFKESEDIEMRREHLKAIGNEIISGALVNAGIDLTTAIKEHSLQMDMTIAYATVQYLETIRKGINRIKFE